MHTRHLSRWPATGVLELGARTSPPAFAAAGARSSPFVAAEGYLYACSRIVCSAVCEMTYPLDILPRVRGPFGVEYFEIIRCSRGRMATLSIDPMFGQAALSVPQQEHGTQRTQYAHLALPRSGLFVHHPKSAIIEYVSRNRRFVGVSS